MGFPLSSAFRFRRWLGTLAALVFLGPAWAHDPGLSTLAVRLTQDRLEATIVLAVFDASEIVELDVNRDFKFSDAEKKSGAAQLGQMAAEALEISFDGRDASLASTNVAFDDANNVTVLLTYPAVAFTNLTVRSKWLALLPIGHRQLFTLTDSNNTVLAERMLNANADRITVERDLSNPAPAPLPPVVKHTFKDFLVLGVEHIWTGYDHLLFLFGLLMVTPNFRAAVKIITSFTVAHSLTLAVATLGWVHVSSRVVEPLIAASIVYVGVENLVRGESPKGRVWLTFAFGLIHGLGFASVLRELGVGAGGGGITLPLVSFNLGVELGQVVIAAMVLPMILKLRKWPQFLKRGVPVGSALVAALGAFWFVQRVWFSA